MRSPRGAGNPFCASDRISSSGKPFHDASPFARALIEAALRRVLWGTDFPHPNVKQMPNDGELVDLFAAFCPEHLRQAVLVDNPARLYWRETLLSPVTGSDNW